MPNPISPPEVGEGPVYCPGGGVQTGCQVVYYGRCNPQTPVAPMFEEEPGLKFPFKAEPENQRCQGNGYEVIFLPPSRSHLFDFQRF